MTSRTVFLRSLVQAVGLIGFSVAVSGCFQTAGAQVQATMTPLGGAAIVPATLPAGTLSSDQSSQLTAQAQTPVIAPPTAITLIAAAPTITGSPTVPQLVFASPTNTLGAITDTPVATATAFPTNTSLPSLTPTPITYTPTNTATVPTTTLTFTPSYTPTVPTNTPSITPTEPPVITPTSLQTLIALQGTAAFNSISATQTQVALNSPPAATSTSLLTLVALQGTQAFNSISGTQTQAALFDQATSIVATATAGAIQQSTLVATLQGTGGPAPAATLAPTTDQSQGNAVATFTPTLLPTINTGAVAGAMGNIDNNCRYTVVDGDRLFRIALRFGLSTYQVAYPNRLINPDLIVPGEVIVVPGCAGPGTGGTGNTGATAVPGSATGSTYMVVDGDTLYSIATRYGVRVIALAQANGITNINLIYIGQTLTIPGR